MLYIAKRSDFLKILPGVLLFMIISVISHAAEIEIENVIPAYSAAYIVVKDVSKILGEVKASPSWNVILSSPDQKRDKSMVERFRELLGIDLWDMLGLFSNRVAFIQVNSWEFGPPTIIADVRSSKELLEIAQKIIEILGKNKNYEIQPNAGKYLDVPFGIAKPAFRFAFLDNLFIFAPGQNAFEAIVDVYRAKEPSFIDDPKYNMMSNKLSPDGEVFIYMNLEIISPIVQFLTQKTLLQMLGAHDIKAISWKINLFDPARSQEAYIYTGNSSNLMVSLFATQNPLFSIHLIPASVADIFCVVQAADPVLAWKKLMDDMKTVLNEKEYATIKDSILEFESETGLKLEDDFLSLLTGEAGFAASFPEVAIPAGEQGISLGKGLMLFFGVKDIEKCDASVERIFSSAQLQQTEYQGVKIKYIPSLAGPEGPVGYIFAGNMLVFSSIQRLQNIIKEDLPIIASESFAQINSQFLQPYGSVFYVDLRKFGKSLAIASPNELPEDMPIRLQKLGAVGGSVVYDGQGLKIKSVGTQEKNWLETIGDFVTMLRSPGVRIHPDNERLQGKSSEQKNTK